MVRRINIRRLLLATGVWLVVAFATMGQPTGVISGTTSVCDGWPATLRIDVTGISPWSGTLSDGTTFNGNTSPIPVIVTPYSTTTYTISTLRDASGFANLGNLTDSATVTLLAVPGGDLSSSTPVCSGNNSGVVTLTNYTGSIVEWGSSTDDGVNFSSISNTSTKQSYSNLTQTTIYRVSLLLNGCLAYSSYGIIPVNPVFVPTITTTPASPTVCLGLPVTLTASEYAPLPFPGQSFGPNPAGWTGISRGARGNSRNPNADWAIANNGKTFNGVTYSNSNNNSNGKFAIVTGTTDGPDNISSLTSPPFNLVGVINPVFNYVTALNFKAGTIGSVEISTNGGTSWTTLLPPYVGLTNVGIPNNGWVPVTISLNGYVGQANVRIRFNYIGTAGSNWAIDNAVISFSGGSSQPPTYQWSPTNYMAPTTGDTRIVTVTPTLAGTYTYCVVAKTANGCANSSSSACVIVTVSAPDAPTTTGASSCTSPATLPLIALGCSVENLRWYTSSSGGISIFTGSPYTPTLSSTTTYYVSCRSSAGCESTRTPVTATVGGSAVPGAITGPAAVCAGQNNVTYSVPIISGVTSYNWSYIGSGATINPSSNSITVSFSSDTTSGTLSVTTTTGLCTSAPSTLGITVGVTAPAVGTLTQPICTLPTGSVVLSGLPAGNWTINPGAHAGNTSSTTISGLAAGTYNFTVTNAAGCTSAASANVGIVAPTLPAAPTVGTITYPTCEMGSTGSVTLSGLPAGSWTINPGAVTGINPPSSTTNITGLAAGTYNFTVTAAGCTSLPSINVVIEAPGAITSPTLGTITQPTCTLATGSVILNGLPLTGTWTLTRSPGGITTTGTGTTTTISGLAVGTYNFTITNAVLCTSAPSANVVISAPANPTAPSVGMVTQPTCADPTGSVVLNDLPATVTWTLTRSPGNIITTGSGLTTTITGLPSGITYTYTVTDASGCISGSSGIVVINTAVATAPEVGTITQPSCTESTGSVILNGLPATGTWTLTRSPGGSIKGTGTSTSITGLAPGTYTFTVADAAECISLPSANVVINIQPSTPAAPIVSITQPSCTVSTGSVVLTGLPSEWTVIEYPSGDNKGFGTAPSLNITGLIAGTYFYTVANTVSWCESELSGPVIINSPPAVPAAPTGTTPETFCAIAVPTVAALTATGTAIQWYAAVSGGTALPTSTVLVNGTTYYASQTGADCESNARLAVIVALSNPGAPTGTTPQPFCGIDNPTVASLTVTGTTIQWYAASTGGAPLATTTALVNGTTYYASQIVAGCESTVRLPVAVTISSPAAPTVGTITQPACHGSTGSVVLNGLPSNWTIIEYPSGDNQGFGTAPSLVITGLTAGTYYFTATSIPSFCESPLSAPVVINEPPAALTATLTSQVNVACFGGANGSVVITPSGGTGPYVITPAQTGLAAGTHTFTVTDNNGCTTTIDVTITQPAAALSATLTSSVNVLCFGASTGSAVITPSGGTGPYVITPAQTALNAGLHTFTVTDAHNCTTTATATITQPAAALAASITAQTNVLCFGNSTGQATVTATGGTPGYTYAWAPSGGTAATATGLAAGTYTVTVTDINGCTTTATATITQPAAALAASITAQTNVLCFGNSTGQATVTATGGTPGYTYAWAPSGGTAATATGLAAGTYTVTVTDANGCSSTATATITQPAGPLLPSVVSASQQICTNAVPAMLTATAASGGTLPYTYQWQSSPDGLAWANILGETGLTYSPPALTATTYYRIVVTDGAIPACPSVPSLPVVITVNPLPTTSPIYHL